MLNSGWARRVLTLTAPFKFFLSFCLMAVCSLATVHAQSAAPRIALVQEAGKDAGETMSSSLAFNTTNKTGDLIVVAVLAGTAGEGFSITDSNRTAYRKAVQYDVRVDGDTLGLFYAENVAGGANAVTVSATMQDNLRFVILEYSGVATANSLDATAAAQGTSTSPNNANSVTTANGDLLLGAVMTAAAANFSAGNGYITEASVPTEPGTRLMVEDQVQSTAGAASASASLSASDKWGAAWAAFKAAGAAGSTGPSIRSLSPTSGLVGTAVTITGTNFGSTQGTVTFNGTTATPTNWNATSIAVTVPSGATTGNVVVTVGGIASNGASFTVNTPAPNITGINPTSGLVGTAVTITGTNFGSTQGTSTVTFNGTKATPANWNATSIAVAVPSGATTGNVVVTVGGIASNGVSFIVASAAPRIALVQEAGKDAGETMSSSLAFNTTNKTGDLIVVAVLAGTAGEAFTITDSNRNTYRKAVQYDVTVDGDTLGLFYAENVAGGANAVTVSATMQDNLRFVILEYSGVATANSLDATAAAQGTSTSPNNANSVTTANGDLLLGAVMTAAAANFSAGNGYITEASVPTEPGTRLMVEDQVQSTAGAASASASLSASDKWGAALAAFKAAGAAGSTGPSITSLSPTSGLVGTAVTITGTNFGSTQGTVTFNGTTATPTNWNATSIAVTVPSGATTGNVVVTVGGIASNGASFTVVPDTTAPAVKVTAPASNASVSGTITITAMASDPDSPVAFVQFQVDGSSTGGPVGAAPYSLSLDTTTLTNGNHTLTAFAQDPAGNQGTRAAVTVTVSNTSSTAMVPLKQRAAR